MNQTPHPTAQTDAQTEALQAAAFRRLVAHLQQRTDVQNIDLMNLAGFCRNCLSRWYREAAEERHIPLSDAEARQAIYGMPYEDWKTRYQGTASAEQQRGFEQAIKAHQS